VHGFLAGVGGVNVSPGDIAGLVRGALQSAPPVESTWAR
jgi:hypothetical protein